MERSTLWIAEDIARDLGIGDHDFPCRILEVKHLLYEVLRDGGPRDIVVLPFFRNYDEVIAHIRDRGIEGPVIIYTQGETFFTNISEMAGQGVLFLDASHFGKPMMSGFLAFLRRSQDMITLPPAPEEPAARPFSRATRDVKEIHDLFRQIMRHRARFLVSCQFREDLPTLCVTCEAIQLVGEIEPKLVLDKFNPQEFVGLYAHMANGKPLTAFLTMEEESLGFELRVVHTVMDKITTLLPTAVFENRRRFFRVEPDNKEPVSVHILPEGSATKTFSVKDVSEGGIGLNSSFSGLALDAVYPMALILPGNRILLGSARVVVKETLKGDHLYYGLTLMLGESDLVQVRQYVYKRQAAILSAIRNLEI